MHSRSRKPEIWGGIECTINRVGSTFNDQLKSAGHYEREGDLEKIAELGIKKMRYPVLWENHQTLSKGVIDWSWSEAQLSKIRSLGITPIVGLVHHGSGPSFTQLDDKKFPELLAEYAHSVASKFPWLEYYTPVNEPLTTARFSGLYGFWYPHAKKDKSFAKMLLHQLKATVLSMAAIRQVNPRARLVQTEDLAYTHSTRSLKYQALFENRRRWLTYDILCGKLDNRHPLWKYFIECGIRIKDLHFFLDNPCPPDVMGFNYYVTSERYIDQRIARYPCLIAGGNRKHKYVDTEAVRYEKQFGLQALLAEAWERYNIPIAITECHLNCTREEQLRWLKESWESCLAATQTGVVIEGFTAWSLLGAYDWCSLLTCSKGRYETGVFDVSNNNLRPTANAKLIKSFATDEPFQHPLLHQKGWWNKEAVKSAVSNKKTRPLLIIGKTGTLGNAFSQVCEVRSVPHVVLCRQQFDICDTVSIHDAIEKYRPWAIVNATGFVKVDDAESHKKECFSINSDGPKNVAEICYQQGIPFMTFSSDLVFDGSKTSPYLELDKVKSLNVYGASKAKGEQLVKQVNPDALIIRTSGFFGPWDKYNFAYNVLETLRTGQGFTAANDIITSPTYVPDLVNSALDLFIDEEAGIWHITNDGIISWYDFAREVAMRGGCRTRKLEPRAASEMNFTARRPSFSALRSNKGVKLPSLDNALERYFQHQTV